MSRRSQAPHFSRRGAVVGAGVVDAVAGWAAAELGKDRAALCERREDMCRQREQSALALADGIDRARVVAAPRRRRGRSQRRPRHAQPSTRAPVGRRARRLGIAARSASFERASRICSAAVVSARASAWRPGSRLRPIASRASSSSAAACSRTNTKSSRCSAVRRPFEGPPLLAVCLDGDRIGHQRAERAQARSEAAGEPPLGLTERRGAGQVTQVVASTACSSGPAVNAVRPSAIRASGSTSLCCQPSLVSLARRSPPTVAAARPAAPASAA